MKEGIHHENYREVAFQDSTMGTVFVIRSTVATDRTTQVDGRELPLYPLSISAYSHPFYTGEERMVDTEGRVDKFKKKYARK